MCNQWKWDRVMHLYNTSIKVLPALIWSTARRIIILNTMMENKISFSDILGLFPETMGTYIMIHEHGLRIKSKYQ